MNISRRVFMAIVNAAIVIMLLLMAIGASTEAKTYAKKKQTDIESAIDLTCEYCYPTVGKVTKIKKGIVYISEAGGNVYTMYGTRKDYHKGDVIAMLMYNNGTWDDETDDEIVKSINYGRS